ncbi:MAG: hypothetical protein KGH78_01920 [Candidatus Micrarchaeota archaeon]|nr:hypothetical protein [Candidatus Micrarchaeota archaeon]MDE1846540.1 hypothetical protein [Candidatus Micrarchaeota archaeon]
MVLWKKPKEPIKLVIGTGDIIFESRDIYHSILSRNQVVLPYSMDIDEKLLRNALARKLTERLKEKMPALLDTTIQNWEDKRRSDTSEIVVGGRAEIDIYAAVGVDKKRKIIVDLFVFEKASKDEHSKIVDAVSEVTREVKLLTTGTLPYFLDIKRN